MSLGRLLLTLALVLVLGVALVGAADLWLLPWIVHQQTEVLVPDLTGRSLDEAEQELADLGLRMITGEEVYDPGASAGTVLEQHPPTLRAVRRGRPVTVVVAAGEPLARVPDLVGLSQRQCEIELGRVGLRLGRVARSFDPDGSLGVVAQRPHAGTDVQRESAVSILVREGHERSWHRMPNLVGNPLGRVREELGRAGFDIRRVTYRSDAGQLPGTVLDQWPPAGSRIPTGGSIELVAASRG
ncbi:MAG TPA: PASTA domain-containing protein [Candidatus Krumholzibacteria bacterium]|nr:PASTA domain-containing protein [Candidatus Krumholzibacteria bacterium]